MTVARWPRRVVLGVFLMLAALMAPRAHAAVDIDARSALIVGNASYGFSPLDNPINDARAMAGTLSELGFEVTLLENATMAELLDAVERIASSFRRDGVGLFYYAGHAVQYRGVNYLLPTNFELDEDVDLPSESIDINRIVQAMERSGSGLNIVVLDSCRDYPFGEIDEAFGQGLAGVATEGETLVAYATTAGSVALDGVGINSPYTSALISALELPGYDIYDVFRAVRGKVREATNGRQLPWVSGSIETRVVLRETSSPIQLASAEVTLPGVHWTTIRNSVDPGDFESFLRSFPGSPYTQAAVERMQALLAEGRPAMAPVEAPARTFVGPGGRLITVTECDIWASDPDDPSRVAAGIEWGLVNTRHAIRACAEALAADPENPRLNFLLGRSLDIAERFDEADAVYRKALEAGYPAAYKNLGYMYRTARGHPRDFETAAEYYLDAALRGVNWARNALAKLYEFGYGVPESPADGLYWARLAAADGYAPAMDFLGNAYRMGIGVEVDYAEAARHYRIAAALGFSNSMSNLAHLYKDGNGVPQDIEEAVRWYQRATEAGNPFAPYHLGDLLRKGELVPRDPAQALSFFELAAERGNEWAYWEIGEMYRKGELSEPDLVNAYFNTWIARAAGEERRRPSSDKLAQLASKRLSEIRVSLGDAMARQVERAADAWIAQNSLFQFTLISPY